VIKPNVYGDEQEKAVQVKIFDVLYGDEVCSLVYMKNKTGPYNTHGTNVSKQVRKHLDLLASRDHSKMLSETLALVVDLEKDATTSSKRRLS